MHGTTHMHGELSSSADCIKYWKNADDIFIQKYFEVVDV
jgi:hypothetical protein